MPYLVERHQIEGTQELKDLCAFSASLYNKCNYLIRKVFFENRHKDKKDWARLPDLQDLVKATQAEECFRKLHNTKTAKQTIRRLCGDWSNYVKSAAIFSRHPERFAARPKPPGYKKNAAQVTFYRETIAKRPLKEGVITPTNGCFLIRSSRNFQQVVVTPTLKGFVIEVQYLADAPHVKVVGDGVLCLDLGVNVLVAITSDKFSPILVNGRILKSINQWTNKHRTQRNLMKRYWRLENYFHCVSKMVKELCLTHSITKVIIGRNVGWKTGGNLGRRGNQNFQQIPFLRLQSKLEYKLKTIGVEVVYTEESYTSKASFKDGDKLEKGFEFSGKRTKRGFYVNADGSTVNADVNGSLNIGRKVISDPAVIARLADRSLTARPRCLNPLRRREARPVSARRVLSRNKDLVAL